MIKTLCIGHASYEIYIQTDGFIKEGIKERYVNKISCGGGVASNVSYLLSKWGIASTFAGVIGNDVFGQRIKKEFESLGSDTRYIETSFDKDTTISFIMVDTKNNGMSTLLNVADEYSKLTKYDFDFQPDLIFVDGHDPYVSKASIERFPKSVTVCSCHRFNPDVVDLAKKCQYIICSKGFAEEASKLKIDYNNTNTLVNVYDALRKQFDGQEIIITIENKGAVYMIENQIKVSPSLMVAPMDTTGAGDIFKGAFCYSIIKDHDLEKAIKFGNIAAGLSLGKIGTRLSIPKLEDVVKVYEKNA